MCGPEAVAVIVVGGDRSHFCFIKKAGKGAFVNAVCPESKELALVVVLVWDVDWGLLVT